MSTEIPNGRKRFGRSVFTQYLQLLNTLGAKDQVGAMRELARLHALDLAEQDRARSCAVPELVAAFREAVALVEVNYGQGVDNGYWPTVRAPLLRMRKVLADLAAAHEPQQGAQATEDTSDELHPATRDLVTRFAAAMADKLLAAQRKYGYSDGWADPGWMDECRVKLLEHVAKGDPRDVANYCAFLWHHGASTAGTETPRSGDAPVAWMQEWTRDLIRGLPDGQVAHAPLSPRQWSHFCVPLYTAHPADAQDGGVTLANYNEGTVVVPVKELREVLDGNLAAAEDALPQAGNSIDFIEARGGADADEASDRIAYHLFYAMLAAEKLRPLLPQIPDDSAMGAGGGE